MTAAIIGTLLVPFVAVVCEAVTGQRLHDGPMGKPDRVLALSVGSVIAVGVGPQALTWTFGLIAVLTGLTVARRVRRAWSLAAVPDRELVDA